jgi:hypothetical protein
MTPKGAELYPQCKNTAVKTNVNLWRLKNLAAQLILGAD